jgi:hypothetical protein
LFCAEIQYPDTAGLPTGDCADHAHKINQGANEVAPWLIETGLGVNWPLNIL